MSRLMSRRRPAPPSKTRTGLTIVDTAVWGAPLWKALHTAAAGAPASWPAIPAALRDSLPCPDCDAHYNAWYAARPPPVDPTAAAQWLLDLHNDVNSRRGIPVWTLDQVLARYPATPDAVAAARAALATLNGVIGVSAYNALSSALATPI